MIPLLGILGDDFTEWSNLPVLRQFTVNLDKSTYSKILELLKRGIPPFRAVPITVKNGSSGKCVPGVVEVVEPEFEILHVTEPIGLALHGLDFVIEAFQRPIGYFVGVIPSNPCMLVSIVEPTALSCLIPEVNASKAQLRRNDLAWTAVP